MFFDKFRLLPFIKTLSIVLLISCLRIVVKPFSEKTT
nr:MAG TPA: hypothetical protein [Caudoviricetes sp.]